MKAWAVVGATLLVAGSAFALQPAPQSSVQTPVGFSSVTDLQNFFAIQQVEVKEVTVNQAHLEEFLHIEGLSNARPNQLGITDIVTDIGGSLGSLNKWITLGQKIWDIIVAGKPVANVSTQRIAVLPASQPDWLQMENWKGPEAKTYEVSAKNLYGMTVMSHSFTIAYNYGGQIDGQGAFLANATVIPSKVSVSWGFTLNSKVEVGQAVNTGTKASPVPGIELQLKWSMDSILKHLEGVESFFVRGSGETTRVSASGQGQ